MLSAPPRAPCPKTFLFYNRPSKSFKALQNLQLKLKIWNFEWNIDMNMAFEIQDKEHKYSPPP